MKYLIILTILILSCSKKPESFTGYVVQKEYTPQHMSDQHVSNTVYAGVCVPCITTSTRTRKPKATLIKEAYRIYVANKDYIKKFYISKNLFNKINLGSKITIKL